MNHLPALSDGEDPNARDVRQDWSGSPSAPDRQGEPSRWEKFLSWLRPYAARKADLADRTLEAMARQEIARADTMELETSLKAEEVREKRAERIQKEVETVKMIAELPPDMQAALRADRERFDAQFARRSAAARAEPERTVTPEQVQKMLAAWDESRQALEAETGTRLDIYPAEEGS